MKDLWHEETEQAVLGAGLLRAIHTSKVSSLPTERFYDGRHRSIHECMIKIHERGDRVDLLGVMTLLERQGALEHLGGWEYLSRLQDKAAGHVLFAQYCDTLADYQIRRESDEIGRQLQRDAREASEGSRAAADAQSSLEEALERRSAGHSRSATGEQILEAAALSEQEHRERAAEHGSPGIPTSLELWRVVGTVEGEDYRISADSGTGKTTMLTHLTVDCLMGGHPAHIALAADGRREQFMARLATNYLARHWHHNGDGISDWGWKDAMFGKLKGERLSAYEWAKSQLAPRVKDLLTIDDTPSPEISALLTEAARVQRKKRSKGIERCPMLGIDYANDGSVEAPQRMSRDPKNDRETYISKAINGFIQRPEQRWVGMTLLQPRKIGGGIKSRRPSKDDASGSSRFFKDSAALVFLYDEDQNTTDARDREWVEIEMYTGKSRFGYVSRKVWMHGPTGYFTPDCTYADPL